jgi:hypothetical protein
MVRQTKLQQEKMKLVESCDTSQASINQIVSAILTICYY